MWTYRVKDSKTNALVLEVSPSSPVAQPRAEPPVGLAGIDKEIRVLQARGDGVVGDVAVKPRTIDLTVIISATDAASYVAVRQQLRDAFVRDDSCYLEIVTPQFTAQTSPFVCTQIYETPTGPFACEMTFRLLLPTPDLMVYGAPQTLSLDQTTFTSDRHVVWDLSNAVNSTLSSLPGNVPQWVLQYGSNIWILMQDGSVSWWQAANLAPVGISSVGLSDCFQLFIFNNQLFARATGGLRRWTGSAWQAWGPPFAGGIVTGVYVTGDRLLVAGSFTSPQKYYVELNTNGVVVSPPLFASITSGILRAAWGGEGMRLYAGKLGANVGVWCGRADVAPIQVARSDNEIMSFAGSSFSSVYMSTRGELINGAPSGKLVSIRYGQAFAPVGEGLAQVPRLLVESGNDIYVPCLNAGGVSTLYRIHRGGLQVLATSNGSINCAAYLPDYKKLVIVGDFSQISRLLVITPVSPPHSGWAIESTGQLLSAWREYGNDCWSADLSQPVPARTYITPSRSTNHGSGTDWRTHRKYTPAGAKLYMTYRHETTGQLQPVYLRDGI